MAFKAVWKWMYGWDYSVPDEQCRNICRELGGKYRQVNYQMDNETHYVLVIHGTFDAPNPDNSPLKWYQLDPQNTENFCTMLQLNMDHLEQENSGGASLPDGTHKKYGVWRDLPAELPQELVDLDPKQPLWSAFSWDGENSDASRVKAGLRLGKLLRFLATADPSARIHIVAHSHGGNVLLKAVEAYMSKLAVQSQDQWHPAIKESFWSAYKNQWKLARKWRKVPHVAWFRRLNPFLVVRRSYHGELTRGIERYPFAYYKLVDDLLGLGDVRQQIFLQHRKASSPVTNALGSLTFLGTPFLVRRFSALGIFSLILGIVIKGLVAALLLWVYLAIIFLVMDTTDALRTAWQMRLGLFCTIFVVATIAMATSSIGRMLLEHGNIYHHIRYRWSQAMLCLVAHAGLLDEAAMGLSAEPVVEGVMVPKIQELLASSMWASWPSKKEPHKGTLRNALAWAYYVFRVIFSVWINALGIIPILQWCLARALGPTLGNGLKAMVMEMTLGLSDKDYAYGRIDVEHVLRLPVAEVQHWNVQQLIAAHQQKDSHFALKLKGGQLLKVDSIINRQMQVQRDSQRQMEAEQAVLDATPLNANGQSQGAPGGAQTPLAVEDHAQDPSLLRSVEANSTDPSSRAEAAPGNGEPTLETGAVASISLAEALGAVAAAESALGLQPLEKPLHQGSSTHSILEYSFLWNQEELDREAENCGLFQALKPRMDKLPHNPDLTKKQFEDELKGICLMFEKRIMDLLGGVEFSHSIYFKNSTIIYAIAYFIVHRELPPWANEQMGLAKGVAIKIADD